MPSCLSPRPSSIFAASEKGLDSPPPPRQAKGVDCKIYVGSGGRGKAAALGLGRSRAAKSGYPASLRLELFRAVLPSPLSVDRPQWPSSRSLSSLQKEVLPRMQMRQGLGPETAVSRGWVGRQRGDEKR